MTVRRFLAGIGLTALVAVGVGLLAGGAALRSAYGADGGLRQPLPPLTAPAGVHTVVIDVQGIAVQSTVPVPGQVALAARSADGRDVVLALGTTEAADAALAGAGYAVAALGDGSWTFAEVPGAVSAADIDPVGLTAVRRGNPVEVAIDGPTTVVLRNADGAAPVVVDLAIEWHGRGIAPISWIMVGVGSALLIAAVIAILAMLRSRRRPT